MAAAVLLVITAGELLLQHNYGVRKLRAAGPGSR